MAGMTFNELRNAVMGEFKPMNAHNGRPIPKRYWDELGDREVRSVWSEISVSKGAGFSNFARPCVMAYISIDLDWLGAHKMLKRKKA